MKKQVESIKLDQIETMKKKNLELADVTSKVELKMDIIEGFESKIKT